uniref:Putative secreted protein n=1 Tax=Anopheles darlingi TaxID=43151 RepID=A0A2M4DGT1_ANODA
MNSRMLIALVTAISICLPDMHLRRTRCQWHHTDFHANINCRYCTNAGFTKSFHAPEIVLNPLPSDKHAATTPSGLMAIIHVPGGFFQERPRGPSRAE